MKATSEVKNLINHVALVVDGSGSMAAFSDAVIKIGDELVGQLAQKSKDTDQETRISLYVFEDADVIHCHTYDKDVLRMPSLKGLYRTVGRTPLVDATIKAIEDLKQTAVLYGDHAFLAYVLTDGAENASRHNGASLKKLIENLGSNWTTACFVPGKAEALAARSFGFPVENVQIWETSGKGIREVGETIRRTVDTFYTMRSAGVRGSRNLFALDINALSKTDLSAQLTPLHFGQFRLYDVETDIPIAEFVESKTNRPYRLGEGYYQLIKPEKVQPQKDVAIYHKHKHQLFVGAAARQLLKLPSHEVKVGPESNPDFDIFIQSGSVNRKLLKGQKLVVMS